MTPRRHKVAARSKIPPALPIHVPQFQNWDCHGCTFCCRNYMAVKVSAAEKQRIEEQAWTEADGVEPVGIFVAFQGGFRLGHREDGACVFLDTGGRCRIHARFGEAAKPLACRFFPFAIHPADGKLAVSLRFSCPSVAFNRGRPLSERHDELRQIAREIVPVNYREEAPPLLLPTVRVPWPAFMRYVHWLDESIARPGIPIALKLMRTFACLRAIETARADRLAADQPDKLLGMLSRGVAERMPVMPEPVEQPSRFGWFMFRVMLFEYARTEKIIGPRRIRSSQVKVLLLLCRFLRAKGRLPALRQEWGETAFEEVGKPFGQLPADAESILIRFFRVKIQGLHFCGRAQDGLPLIEGFHGLALLYPVILWLSRCRAASARRTEILADDVAHAIMIADHHYGNSARLGSYAFRKMVRLLAQRDDVGHLCGWYSL